MIAGRSIITWILLALIAIVVFVIARWAVPELFTAAGVTMPRQVASAIALLIALAVFYGGYTYRGA